jgi:hypothetical protein
VVRRPPQLLAKPEEPGLEGVVAAAVGDVPLAGGDDLERLVALLVEVRHAGGGLRVAVEVAALAQRRDGGLAGREGRLARQRGVRVGVRDPLGGLGLEPAVAADHRAGGEVQLAPPGDVGEVAEGTAHRDARALVGFGRGVREYRDLDAEQRRGHRRPEQVLVALVVRVGDQGAHRDQQLRARGLDVDRGAVGLVERDAVVRAGVLAGLQLRLRDGGVERDVP